MTASVTGIILNLCERMILSVIRFYWGLKYAMHSSMSRQDNQSSRGWVLPPYYNQVREAGLYLVATPIGNMGDISIRALDTLAAVDIVLCEDTRVSKKLLSHFGIEARLEAYHDHSDKIRRDDIIRRIGEGVQFALISDAGMPLISDPGYKLVYDVRAAGFYVTSISGANAPLTALQLSGMPSDSFSFIGFLPHKQTARRAVLEKWRDVPGSLVAFEGVSRLKAALHDIETMMAGRKVSVVREISKKFEEVREGLPADLLQYYEEESAPKGEIVLVVAPPAAQDFDDSEIEAMLREALEHYGTKAAAAKVAEKTGRAKKALYDLALKVAKDA